jgi:O-antigen ligase
MKLLTHKLTAFLFQYAIPATLVAAALLLLASPYPYLAVLPGFAVLGLLWVGRRDMVPYLFYGIVALIPFGAYRGLGGQFSFMHLHWILAALLTALVAVRILLRKKIPDEVRQGKFWGIVLFFYIFNILAALGSKFPEVSSQFMVLLAVAYLLVALGMVVVDRRGFFYTLPSVIVGSVFIGSVLAVLGSVSGLSLFVSPVTGRVLGTAPDPNNMSLMIIFSLPLAVFFLLTAHRPWTRLALLLIIVVDVAAVIATFSRGGAIILAGSCLLMLWEFRHRISPRNLGLLLGAAGLAAALFLLLTPEAYTQRVKSVRDADDFAMRRRASYVSVARELVPERPLLGYGPGTFSSLYAQTETGRTFKRKNSSGKRDAHNTYIEVLIGSGLAGLSLFVLLLFYSLTSLSRARRLFLASGLEKEALLTTAYRVSFITLLIYLMIFSDVYHKYLLVSLAISQIALRLACRPPVEPDYA